MFRKQWPLGFLGLLAFQGVQGIVDQNWGQAIWLVWVVWFIHFIPDRKQS